MPELHGGFDAADIDAGMRALAQADGMDALRQAIRTMPVLWSPHFHAQLRQQRLAFGWQALQAKGTSDRAFAQFMQIYDHFFALLHTALHVHQQEPEPEPEPDDAPVPGPAAGGRAGPAFFHALIDRLGDCLPEPDGPTFYPPDGKSRIEEDLARITGGSRSLPDFGASPGSLWGLHRVSCLRCGAPRLSLRAHYLDLGAVPALVGALEQRQINADRCARCGSARAMVERVWVIQPPLPLDPLAVLSCLCRVSDSEMIYWAPAGTVRRPDRDRVLEIRLDMMIRHLCSDGVHDVRTGDIHTDGVAYSAAQLLERLHRTQDEDPALIGYFDVCQSLTEKLRSGELPFRDAETLVRRMVGPMLKRWPLHSAGSGEPHLVLVQNLVFAACAEAQELPAAVQAGVAATLTQNYATLGEVGLAEMSLARAEDLLRSAGTAGDAAATATAAGLAAARESLLIAQGRYDQAADVRAPLLETLETGDDPAAQIVRHALLTNQALHLRTQGRLADAMQAMQATAAALEQLDAQLRPTDPPAADAARQGLSGNLANLSGVYLTVAEFLSLLDAMAAHGGDVARYPPLALAAAAAAREEDRFATLYDDVVNRVQPLLDAQFPEGHSIESLVALAEQLLRRALGLAAEVGDREYLGIQSANLGRLLRDTGRADEAAAAFRDAMRHAARAGDLAELTGAALELADVAAAAADHATALGHLQQAMRAQMRQAIRSGNAEGLQRRVVASALRSGLAAGEPAVEAQAIVIAESAKQIAIAVSMARGVPLQAGSTGGAEAQVLQGLLADRERLRLLAMWEVDSEAATQQQLADNATRLAAARAALALRDPRYARWHDATFLELPTPQGLARQLARIGPHATLAGFVIDRATAWAYALWPGGQLLRQHALDAATVQALGAAGGPPLQDLAAALMALLEPRLAQLAADDALLVSPCDALERVAFAALHSNGRRLCQRATLSVIHGVGMLDVCLARPPLALRRAVCLGAPSRPDVPALPGAAREVEAVSALLEGSGVAADPPLLGAAATVAALALRAAEADLLHLACHAVPPAAGQPDARLLLALDGNSLDSGVLGDDRIVAELLIKPGAHVNLAACSSGLQGGPQAFVHHGLVPALLVCGAGSVLGCLWPIGDDAAVQFQSAYTTGLIAGMGPPAALAAAQRAALQGTLGAALQNASNWAGYVLYGAR